MDQQNLVSIIVPIYMVENYVEKCIASICNQTYKNIEIILVDDGSKDMCGKIIDQYAQIDSRIVPVHKENGGLVSARKAGLDVCSGEYIVCVDGDDWIDPIMVETLLESMLKSGADVVSCGAIREYGGNYSQLGDCNIVEGLYDKSELEQYIYPKMLSFGKSVSYGGDFDWGICPSVWAKIYKKNTYEKYQMVIDDKISYGEDVALIYPLLLGINKLQLLNQHFYHVVIREDSMTAKKSRDDFFFEKTKVLRDHLIDSFKKTSYMDIMYPQLARYMGNMVLLGAKQVFGVSIGDAPTSYLFRNWDEIFRKKIVIYGAGKVGQCYYEQLAESGICDVVKWVDKNALLIDDMRVSDLSSINETEYDFILLSVLKSSVADEIRNELLARGIDLRKVLWREPKIIKGSVLKKSVDADYWQDIV